MKLEYTRPEIEVTLFSTESIMDSATGDNSTIATLPIDGENLPAGISANTWIN